jgi:hypothetical protein
MFSSEEKVKEIIEWFGKREIEQNTQYAIDCKQLYCICEDFMVFKQECDNMSEHIQRLENYIRLLEKENKELRENK